MNWSMSGMVMIRKRGSRLLIMSLGTPWSSIVAAWEVRLLVICPKASPRWFGVNNILACLLLGS